MVEPRFPEAIECSEASRKEKAACCQQLAAAQHLGDRIPVFWEALPGIPVEFYTGSRKNGSTGSLPVELLPVDYR